MSTKPPPLDEAVKAGLARRYSAPGRHYHDLAHISAMLDLLAGIREELHDPEAVEAAIWFHDAVYDSHASDNEARSADLAARMLAGRTDPARIAAIRTMIFATATHRVPDEAGEAEKGDIAALIDMDLAALGGSVAAFDAYEAAVRREYGWVDDAGWRAGRRAVLESFLARPRIFLTERFRARFEDRARENLARSIARLKAEG